MTDSAAPHFAQPVDTLASLPGLVPYMTDDALIDLVSIGNVVCQMAIASSPSLRPQIGAALAEVGSGPALLTLAQNHDVDLRSFSLARMIERFGTERGLLAAMEGRPDLPDQIWPQLAAARLRLLLADFDADLKEDDVERLVLSMLKDVNDVARLAYARHFVGMGTVTPGLLFRAILSGEIDAFGAMVSALTEMSVEEIVTTLRVAATENVEILARTAGVPDAFIPAFVAAIVALRAERGFSDHSEAVSVRLDVIHRLRTIISRDQIAVHQALIDRIARLELEVEARPSKSRDAALRNQPIHSGDDASVTDKDAPHEGNVTPFPHISKRDAA